MRREVAGRATLAEIRAERVTILGRSMVTGFEPGFPWNRAPSGFPATRVRPDFSRFTREELALPDKKGRK